MHAGKVGLVVLGLFLFAPFYAQAFQFQDVVEKAKSRRVWRTSRSLEFPTSWQA